MGVVKAACPKCRHVLQVSAVGPVKCPHCASRFVARPSTAIADQGIQVSTAAGATVLPPTGNIPAHPPRKKAGLPIVLVGAAGAAVLLVGALALLAAGAFFFGAFGNGSAGPKLDDSVDKLIGPGKMKSTVRRLPKQAKSAIDKGVKWLKQQILTRRGAGAQYTGECALAGLTLLECGVSPADPAVKKTIDIVHANRSETFAYTVALSILFMDRLIEHKGVAMEDKSKHRDLLRKLALQLVASQHTTGGWAYNGLLLTAQQEQKVYKAAAQGNYSPKETLGRTVRIQHDNSVAQFCVLALWAARKYDVPVAHALMREENRYRTQQNKATGRWPYRGPARSNRRINGTPAMTCSGLLGLAVAAGIRDDEAIKDPALKGSKIDISGDPAVTKALGFVGKTLDPLHPDYYQQQIDLRKRGIDAQRKGNVALAREITKQFTKLQSEAAKKGININNTYPQNLYFLWSLERVAVVYGLDRIEGRDWYGWGWPVVVGNQKGRGNWTGPHGVLPNTCFALLFLNRSNLVKDLTDKLRRLTAQLVPGDNRPVPPGPARQDV